MLIVAFSARSSGPWRTTSGMKKISGRVRLHGITSTALLVFVGKGDWFLASLLYIVGMVVFREGINFYDSLLPHIAREGRSTASLLMATLLATSAGTPFGVEPGHDHEARVLWDTR